MTGYSDRDIVRANERVLREAMMSRNDPGPGTIDAVSTADDWRETVNSYNREGWDEMERDPDDPGEGWRWDEREGYVLVVCPGCHMDPCHCDTMRVNAEEY